MTIPGKAFLFDLKMVCPYWESGEKIGTVLACGVGADEACTGIFNRDPRSGHRSAAGIGNNAAQSGGGVLGGGEDGQEQEWNQ